MPGSLPISVFFRRAPLGGVALSACLASGACLVDAEPPGQTEGRLNTGEFEYRCVDKHDAFDPCGEENAFPETIAVGAEFELHFFAAEGEEHPVVSAAPSKLLPMGGHRFKVLESGPVAVLALRSQDEAADFVHLNAKPIERIGVRDQGGDEDLSELRLVPAQARTLTARPYAASSNQVAAGALLYRWSSSDPKVMSIVVEPHTRSVTVVAVRPGAAVLTVRQGDTERSIDVRVASFKANKATQAKEEQEEAGAPTSEL